jgi:O-phosphoseryl-tRNA(Cys) synthetase
MYYISRCVGVDIDVDVDVGVGVDFKILKSKSFKSFADEAYGFITCGG